MVIWWGKCLQNDWIRSNQQWLPFQEQSLFYFFFLFLTFIFPVWAIAWKLKSSLIYTGESWSSAIDCSVYTWPTRISGARLSLLPAGFGWTRPSGLRTWNGFLPCSTDSRHSPCFSCLTVSQVFTHHSAFGGSTAWGRILKNQRSEIYKQASHPAWALSKALVAIVEVEILQVERMVYILVFLIFPHCTAKRGRSGWAILFKRCWLIRCLVVGSAIPNIEVMQSS